MTCDEYQEQASQLVDGELDQHKSSELFVHLSACASCRAFMHSALDLRAQIRHQPELTLPEHLDKQIQRLISEGKRSKTLVPMPLMQFWKRRVTISLATAAIAGVFIAAAGMSAVWFGIEKASQPVKPKEVYIMTLPTVEVQGYRIPNEVVAQ